MLRLVGLLLGRASGQGLLWAPRPALREMLANLPPSKRRAKRDARRWVQNFCQCVSERRHVLDGVNRLSSGAVFHEADLLCISSGMSSGLGPSWVEASERHVEIVHL